MDQAGLAHAFDPGRAEGHHQQVLPAERRFDGAARRRVRHRHRRGERPLAGRRSQAGRSAAVGHDRRRALQRHLARSRRTWPRCATPRPGGWPPIPPSMSLRKQLARLKSRLDGNSVSLNEAERRQEQAEDKMLAKATAAKAEAVEAGIPAYEITRQERQFGGPARTGRGRGSAAAGSRRQVRHKQRGGRGRIRRRACRR